MKLFYLKKPLLVFLAGLLWFIAGANIVRIGILAYVELWENGLFHGWRWILPLLSLLVFAGFFFMFRKITKKNCKRIYGYEGDRVPLIRLMDLRGYLLMIFMMTLGILLRHSGFMPTEFFAAFYTGLGSGLVSAGIRFFFAALKGLVPADKAET